MTQSVQSILIGLAGFTLFGVAMVMMKYGAEVLSRPSQMLRGSANRKKSLIWALGCLANFLYVVLFSIALGMGEASVISALNGFGLVVAAILSRLFLHEKLSSAEVVGIGMIIVGTASVGYFSRPTVRAFSFSPFVFWSFCFVTLLGNLGGDGYTLLHRLRGAGIVFAINAGYLGGLSALLQKIFMTPLMQGVTASHGLIAALCRDPYFYIFIVASMASFAMIQVAYQFGKAVQVVPTFSSAIILTPVVGAAIIFQERLTVFQVVGIVAIILGVFFLTTLGRK
jgi:uncharacterized membrane protein